jgi:hypothetical protein
MPIGSSRREFGRAEIVMRRIIRNRFVGAGFRGFLGLGLLDHADRFLRDEIGGSQMLGRRRRFRRLGIRLDVGGGLAAENIGDGVAGGLLIAGLGALDRLAFDGFLLALRAAMAAAAAPGAVVGFVVGRARGALIFLDQRLPVGDRDLIIIRMDFREGEEAVAVAAVIDEGGLERRLHARHLGEIDIAAKLFTGGGLEVELFHTVAAQNYHPGFLRVGRVDQHFVGH